MEYQFHKHPSWAWKRAENGATSAIACAKSRPTMGRAATETETDIMTLRFGLLGAGRIGKVHAGAVASAAGAKLVAVADAVPRRPTQSP